MDERAQPLVDLCIFDAILLARCMHSADKAFFGMPCMLAGASVVRCVVDESAQPLVGLRVESAELLANFVSELKQAHEAQGGEPLDGGSETAGPSEPVK